jgi:hypothetical protein
MSQKYLYAQCHYAEYHYPLCLYAESHGAELSVMVLMKQDPIVYTGYFLIVDDNSGLLGTDNKQNQ